MRHALLVELTRVRDEWHGHAPLPTFAAVGALPDTPPDWPVEAPVARNVVRPRWRAVNPGRVVFVLIVLPCAFAMTLATVAVIGLMELFRRPNPAVEAKERRRAAREAARAAEAADRLRRGMFPVHIDAPRRTPPTAVQDAAVRHLFADPDRVLAAVTAAVYDSFRDAYSQPYWWQISGIGPADSPAALAGRYAIGRVEVAREHRGGIAFLVFPIHAAWVSDHGLLVVYHPGRPAEWATADDLGDLLDPDDGGRDITDAE